MEALKGVVKIAIALVAIGAGTELGKRGLNNLRNGLPQNSNKQTKNN